MLAYQHCHDIDMQRVVAGERDPRVELSAIAVDPEPTQFEGADRQHRQAAVELGGVAFTYEAMHAIRIAALLRLPELAGDLARIGGTRTGAEQGDDQKCQQADMRCRHRRPGAREAGA
ncbi:MAG: hypothetical protein IPG43_16975 [Proteobacteria bacterium]|nr:hypothetical protein [Pseudomonadota bacterium]